MDATVSIPTNLRLNISGTLTTPDTDHDCPIVLLLHGFTGRKEEVHIVTLAEELRRSGIATLRFDAPGSGESDGTPDPDYTMTNYISVVKDVLRYAQSLPGIDTDHIGIWGHSMGGFVALASAVRYSDIMAVCCCQPSSGWKVVDSQTERVWRETGWMTFGRGSHRQVIRLPYNFLMDRARYDATQESPQLAVPSLFIAGEYDTDVTPDSVLAMARLAPQPTSYLQFPATHGYKRDPDMLKAITAAAVDFFRTNLAH